MSNTTWLLALVYWVHLMMTVIWIGGLAIMSLIALPAWRAQTLGNNQWLDLQKRLTPWVNVAMALLWVTGFIQMTNHEQYNGFLAMDSTWAWAILLKHVAVLGIMVSSLYVQLRLHPEMTRVQLLEQVKPQAAAAAGVRLAANEVRLLRINVGWAAVILLFTALATAS